MKLTIRKKISPIRDGLTKKTIEKKSRLILINLIKMSIFKNSKNISCYVSQDSEVDTHRLIKLIIQSKRKVIVPFVDKEMNCAELFDFNKLMRGKFGILEPKEKKRFNKDMLDLIIIPGVVFDRKGNRIGRGKGYYDKF
ncbi:5-formyltetrahydrofolate cyclo-ligase [Candidatus Woesearchaeota archaeon]|nr:5-formyltetrahydrofolate cyclo-ligase [Candidatus Woesearchaeota archaeon]